MYLSVCTTVVIFYIYFLVVIINAKIQWDYLFQCFFYVLALPLVYGSSPVFNIYSTILFEAFTSRVPLFQSYRDFEDILLIFQVRNDRMSFSPVDSRVEPNT